MDFFERLGWQPFEHQLIGCVEERTVAASDL